MKPIRKFVVLLVPALYLLAGCSQVDAPAELQREQGAQEAVPMTRVSASVEDEGELEPQQSISYSPSGCGAYADYPHRSSTNPNEVVAYARIQCRVAVPQLSINATLYRRSWTGYYSVVARKSGIDYTKSWLRVVPATSCVNGEYAISNSASIIDNDGQTYTGNAYNYGTVSNCN